MSETDIMRSMHVTASNKQILKAFERLCEVYDVVSRGLNPELITAPCDGPAYDGTEQWAARYVKGLGWMVVCGKGGCGVVFGRWNAYFRTRWDFYMFLEIMADTPRHKKKEA